MHGVVLAVNRHIVGISLLVVAILAFAVAQALLVPLTIPLVEQMAAANTERARYVDSDLVSFPAVRNRPAVVAEAPISPPVDGRQLLGEIHLSAGDTPSRPVDPSPANPLRIGFALGGPASVRVTLAGDDGAVVASVPQVSPTANGARVAEWDGANTAGQPVPGGRYTLSVEASDDADVYRKTVHEMHVFVAR
jgi:hypothetical protein